MSCSPSYYIVVIILHSNVWHMCHRSMGKPNSKLIWMKMTLINNKVTLDCARHTTHSIFWTLCINCLSICASWCVKENMILSLFSFEFWFICCLFIMCHVLLFGQVIAIRCASRRKLIKSLEFLIHHVFPKTDFCTAM